MELIDWIGMDRMEWMDGMEWNGVEWSGSNGMEWSGCDDGMEWLMEWFV